MRIMLSKAHCEPELLASIGAIAAESAYLERFIETVILGLAKLPPEVGPLVCKGMIDAKIDLLRELGNIKLKRFPRRKAKFAEIISELKRTNGERSIAIHGIWHGGMFHGAGLLNFTFTPAQATKKGKLGHPEATMTATRAHKLSHEISEAHHDLHEFAYRTWPKAMPGTTLRSLMRLGGQKLPGTRKGAKRTDSPLSR